jgi:hypothetical protein
VAACVAQSKRERDWEKEFFVFFLFYFIAIYLFKFFPGRRAVKNYLKRLNDKLRDAVELTGNQFKTYANETMPMANLPANVEWRHCKGSVEKFRGYPCSLWTLFHVLTVSQVEIEKSKKQPCMLL